MEKEFVEPAANAALKQKWVEALRSGEYQQGYNTLKLDDQYCCLGVACAVAKCGFYYSGLAPLFGLGTEVESILIRMNDSGGRTFPEIADWIETHDLRTGNDLLQAERSDAAPTPLSE